MATVQQRCIHTTRRLYASRSRRREQVRRHCSKGRPVMGRIHATSARMQQHPEDGFDSVAEPVLQHPVTRVEIGQWPA